MLIYPLVLDAEQHAGEVLDVLATRDTESSAAVVAIRRRDRLQLVWYVLRARDVRTDCEAAAATATLDSACELARNYYRDVAEVCDVRSLPRPALQAHGWLIAMSGGRLIGAVPPAFMAAPPVAAAPPAPAPSSGPPPALILPHPHIEPDAAPRPDARPTRSAAHRGQRAKPTTGAEEPQAAGATPEEGVGRGIEEAVGTAPDDVLLALPRVESRERYLPGESGLQLTIGLKAPATPTEPGVMTFVSPHTVTSIDIDVMVEAPDFSCAQGWKHTLTVDKSAPFVASLDLVLVNATPEDHAPRMATIRVHYSYKGQPAGMAVRLVALGEATLEEAAAIAQPIAAPLQLAASKTPLDLVIRIARRDQSETARDLIWTLIDCAHPIVLPDAPLTQKVGDRDTAASFAAKVTSQVGGADGTVTIDNIMRSIGTLIRRAMPPQVLQALTDVAKAVGPSRLPWVLLLTDECNVPWELALLDAPPDAARAPYLGAQFAVSRWIHGETDIPVPPPAVLTVSNLAVVLGNYDASSLAALPHAKEESVALAAESAATPSRFPRVTSVDASADSLVDLLNGALPSTGGSIAPEMVHFACHGEVLGSGVAKRSVLYLSDGSPMSELLFVSSALGRNTKSFLFMNACQVGVGGDELGQYAGFPGMAIGAGFSGFVGPLWSVNDLIAKSIALDFYRKAFGSDGATPRAVAEVLADMRSTYANEPDPKKRQATWLAYVHYGHPHFTLTHA